MIKTIFDHCTDLIYPPHCQVCRKKINSRWPQTVVCPPCRSQIIFNHPPFCLKCSRHLPQPHHHPLCIICRRERLNFDFAWAACAYQSPIKELIHAFKFEDKTYLRFLFADLMMEFINTYQLDAAQFDTIIAMPISAARFRERGFNQSFLLAQEISNRLAIPWDPSAIIKTRHTLPQSELSQKKRFTNLHGAFRMKNKNWAIDRRMLLIDDLLTTGASASELATLLKLSGAKTVGVFTLAVTV